MASAFEEQMRFATCSALDNARQLHREAQILNDECCFSRALALAVIGKEELGKAILTACLSFGFLKPLRQKVLKGGFRNHDAKLLIAEYADICQWQTDEYFQILREETGYDGPIDPLSKPIEFFAALMAEDSTREVAEAGRMMEGKQALGISENELISIDELKQSALYVGLDQGVLQSPKDVDPVATEIQITDLEIALKDFDWLGELSSDRAQWEAVRRGVLRRL